jgi:hypothetical protein
LHWWPKDDREKPKKPGLMPVPLFLLLERAYLKCVPSCVSVNLGKMGLFIVKLRVVLLLASCFLGGCTSYGPFQPPPTPSESWSRIGASEKDVAAALLECGVAEPRGRIPGAVRKMSLDDVALTLLCMEHSGFLARDANSYADFCRNFKEVSSCSPVTLAPPRDVERRLNSDFCKKFPLADVCSADVKDINDERDLHKVEKNLKVKSDRSFPQVRES